MTLVWVSDNSKCYHDPNGENRSTRCGRWYGAVLNYKPVRGRFLAIADAKVTLDCCRKCYPKGEPS